MGVVITPIWQVRMLKQTNAEELTCHFAGSNGMQMTTAGSLAAETKPHP